MKDAFLVIYLFIVVRLSTVKDPNYTVWAIYGIVVKF
jgi:hypothetical protein